MSVSVSCRIFSARIYKNIQKMHRKLHIGRIIMKKITVLLIAALICIVPLFAGGAKEQAAVASDSVAAKLGIKTVTPGVFTVATSPDFAPYEFYSIGADGTPTLAGFDIALAQYIADYLGLKLEIIPMDFDGTIMEVQQKNVDAGMAGYSPDPSRAEAMEFSTIYYAGGQSFVTTKANAAKYSTLSDTNKSNLKIGAQIGSIQVGLAQENSPKADIVQLSKVTDIIAELLNGSLDGAYIETAVAESYSKNYPDLAVVLPVAYEQEGSVVGIAKGNLALLEGVNQAIVKALADGSMNKFVAEANELANGNIYEGLL